MMIGVLALFLAASVSSMPADFPGYGRSVQCSEDERDGIRAVVVAKTPLAIFRTDPQPVHPGSDYAVRVDQRKGDASFAVVRAEFRDAAGRLIPTGLPDHKTRAEFHALWAGDGKRHVHTFKTLPGAATVAFNAEAGAFTVFEVTEVSATATNVAPAAALGSAVREIRIPEKAGAEMLFAARELTLWLEKITGRAHPIISGSKPSDLPAIVLETSGPECAVGIPKADNCDVFAEGRDIHIRGSRESGVVVGVFQFLERNTDIVFPRPDFPGGARYTENPDLAFTNTSFSVRPTWDNRSWGLGYHEPSLLWMHRNYINMSRGANGGRQALGQAEYGPVSMLVYEYGHLVSNEKYFEKHPEYFAEIEGKRKKYGPWGPQLCYTCEEGRRAFVRELFARLETDLTPEVRLIHLCFADSGALCCCANCRAPIRLADGSVVDYEDPAYRSSQYYLYLNKIVADVMKRYPRLRVETLGYIAPAVPPKVKPHPDLHVVWCPYPKNDKNPLRAATDINVKWADRSRVWPTLTQHLGIYEYWGDAMQYPRAVATAAADNLRFWNGLGIHDWIYAEAPCDQRVDKAAQDGAAGTWDMSAMEFWVLTRLMLDSRQDPVALRWEYLRRTYGSAAPAMKAFYDVLQGEWLKGPNGSMYNENPVVAFHWYVREKGKTKFCRRQLDAAEKAADDPRVADLVRRIRVRFEYLYELIARDVPDILEIPDVQAKLGAKPPRADDAVWSRGLAVRDLSPLGEPRVVSSNFNARVTLLHDGTALYARFACAADATERARPGASVDGVGYPIGDRVELMVGDGKSDRSWHFAVGRDGTAYVARGYNHRQKADFQSQVVETKDSWTATLRIPFDAVGLKFPDVRKLTVLPIRAEGVPGKGRFASLAGRKRHDPREFPKAELVR